MNLGLIDGAGRPDGLAVLVRQRMALALAFGALVGAGGFFYWPADVPWFVGLWAVSLGLLVVGWGRVVGALVLMAGIAWMVAGWQVALHKVDWEVVFNKPHWVVGQVAELEDSKTAGRVVVALRGVQVYQLAGLEKLEEVRFSVWESQLADGEAVVTVGDYVAAPLVFLPPQGPIFKGQRDGRIWFFSNPERLWASVRGQVEVTSNTAEKPSWREVFMQGVEGVRQHIGQATQGLAGGVVAALLMGNQRLVAAELREAYRAAGLSHLLAISGMQLTLVGLGVFWVIRRFLALFPVIVLRFDVKFWAAVVGLVAAGFYTLLAGAGVSVVRSLVMVALVMLAILVGRVRDALRAWCVAVVLIILIQPTMVMAAGFQLSIAAVLALILWAEREQVFENWPRWGWLVRVREVCLSSVVAGAATAPIVAWQFGQFSSVGLVANMLAIPLMALATYAGMVALALWPFGLEWLVLPPMAALVEVVNGWAVWLAGLQVLLHGSLYIEGWWVVFVAFMSVAMLVVVWYRLWVWLGVVMVLLVGGIGVAARLEMPLEMAVWDKGKVGIGCDAGGACRLAWAADAERAERLAVLAGVRLVPMAGEIPAKPDAAVAASLPTGNWNWAELRGGEWVVGRPSCAREWQNIAEECQVGWWK